MKSSSTKNMATCTPETRVVSVEKESWTCPSLFRHHSSSPSSLPTFLSRFRSFYFHLSVVGALHCICTAQPILTVEHSNCTEHTAGEERMELMLSRANSWKMEWWKTEGKACPLLVEYEDDVSRTTIRSRQQSIVGSKGFIESCLERRTLRSFLFNLHL